MNFPLYNNLKQNLTKKDLTIAEKEDFMAALADIDENARDLIYVLIQCYRLEHDPGNENFIPYKGTEMNTSEGSSTIYWNLLEFPIPLRHILYKFITMNREKLVDERRRKEAVPDAL